MTTPTPGQGMTASATEALAATIAAAVERQLTHSVAAMAQQVDAARRAADGVKAELRAEFTAALAGLRDQTTAAQQSLHATIDARLADLGHQQQVRLNEVENRLFEIGPAGSGGVDPADLADLRDQIDAQSAAAHARIDELHKATRRFDEQAAALVQHVNDTTVALAQRMDDGNHTMARAVEERFALVRSALEAVGPEVQRQLTDQATVVAQRLDFTEHKVTDRILALEERINEQQGAKIANLEATIGRIGAGFDDAIGAMSHRLLGVENRLEETLLHMATLQEQVSKVDEHAIQAVKDQISAAVGEAMLVRIEMDRIKETLEGGFDATNLRMAEIEALLTDEMDVGAAVQLERLEELERAVAELNPDQFVRRSDPTMRTPAPSLAPSPAPSHSNTSSEPSLSSF